jgi:hypothetical protein
VPDAFSALGRLPLALEASLPGVLAVGDVRHGSVQRVASVVGEGSVAIQPSTACGREPDSRWQPQPVGTPRHGSPMGW